MLETLAHLLTLVTTPYLIVILLGFLTLLFYALKHRNIPPGPRGFPLLGYAPFFGPHPQNTFLELGKGYGNVISLYMGPKLAIVLNDYEAIKAAYVGQADIFTGRADGFTFKYLNTGSDGNTHGIAIAEGEPWKATRRFMLSAFRDLGMGKSKLQDRVLEESEYLSDVFSKSIGTPFDPTKTLASSVSNIVCTLCFGKRFDHEDPVFKKLLVDMAGLGKLLSQAGPMQSYPLLRFLPGRFRTAWLTFAEGVGQVYKFIQGNVAEHIASYNENETRDYIDAFLHQQKIEQNKDKKWADEIYNYEELMTNLRGFFGAGTETTAVTLLWLFLYMMHHPDVQKKVQKEIDANVGRNQSVTLEDKVKLPYVEAVCREVQRLANVTPFGVLRANTEETILLGYRIPKRSYIIPNFLSVNMDPKLWKDPTNLVPERFLDAKGKVVEPAFFMPFSIGKRACVGESLARMEIFLFFANVMQRFELRKPAGLPIPTTNQYTTGISCRPLPYKMDIRVRTE